jgi:hydroxymethylpyrimidine pyrophosphatase-like HAD family hydrolase
VLVGLQALRKTGAQLALASGKPCVYLAGLVRGMDIMDACLLGENGADVWLTSTMPPVRLLQPLEARVKQRLESVRRAVVERFGERVFLQPNTVGVTAFPVDPSLSPTGIAQTLADVASDGLALFLHEDSAEWIPARLDKGRAVRSVAEHLQIPQDRIFAVGHGPNDHSMAAVVHTVWWVGNRELPGKGRILPAETIEDALLGLLEEVKKLP